MNTGSQINDIKQARNIIVVLMHAERDTYTYCCGTHVCCFKWNDDLMHKRHIQQPTYS